MAVLDFPANPILDQEYNFPPFRYRWDGEKWRTIGTGANPVQTQIAEHRVEPNAHAIETITNLREELSALGGTPVLSVVWVQKREAMWPGYVPADGQTLARADYADAYQAIAGGKVPTCTDEYWLDNPVGRGNFTEGDGSSTFRLPDYNGKFAGSLGAAFLRGDGLNSQIQNGLIQSDAIREIEGTFGGAGGGYNRAYDIGLVGDGAFARQNTSGYDLGDIKLLQAPIPEKATIIHFKASHVVPTADDNHPVNVTGCWAVKLVGSAQNAGQIDALTLISQLAAAQSKIIELEQWPQSGSNDNGSWIKHRDGTMIVTAVNKGYGVSITNVAGSLFQSNEVVNIAFPATFVGVPVCTYSVEYITGGIRPIPVPVSQTSTIASLVVQSGASTGQVVCNYYVQAIGRWK